MEEFERSRRGMLTTGEWCKPVSNMYHHIYIKDCERIGHERLENSDIVLGQYPGLFSSSVTSKTSHILEVTQEAGVVPRRARVAIGTPFQSPHAIRRETVGIFYLPFPGVNNVTTFNKSRLLCYSLLVRV